jgi:hypothetical protein
MTDEPDVTKPQEQVLRALMAEKLAADLDPTEVGGLANDELAQQLGVSEEEIRDDLQALLDLGFVEQGPARPTQPSGCTGLASCPPGPMMYLDPIRDADTNPDIWLHARDVFEPIAVTQCYPYVFMTLLEDLEGTGATVGDLTRVLPDDDWLDFLRAHAGIIKCEPQDALKFFATEIATQMVLRINERYPVIKGYSPVHIALVAVCRAMRAAHDELAAVNRCWK